MATVAKKRLIGFDACGTDGSDPSKMKAIFHVVDSEGFSFERVKIRKTIADTGVDTDINNEIAKQAGIPKS